MNADTFMGKERKINLPQMDADKRGYVYGEREKDKLAADERR
jgi:hypothetical protein